MLRRLLIGLVILSVQGQGAWAEEQPTPLGGELVAFSPAPRQEGRTRSARVKREWRNQAWRHAAGKAPEGMSVSHAFGMEGANYRVSTYHPTLAPLYIVPKPLYTDSLRESSARVQ